jgi:hypothetical protein
MSRCRRRCLLRSGAIATLLLAGCGGRDDGSSDATGSSPSSPSGGGAPTGTTTPAEAPATGDDDWQSKLGPRVRGALGADADRIPVIAVVAAAADVPGVANEAEAAGGEGIRRLASVPAVAARLPPDGIERVARRPDVVEVRYDRGVVAH